MSDPNLLAADLRLVLGRLVRRLRAERSGLSLMHVAVLGRLDRDGPSPIGRLADGERVRPQSMATTVSALEKAGLVERGRDPADGRRVVIDLTPAGRRALAADREQRVGWLAGAIAADLSEREQRTLAAALELLARLADREP
jgi:DNA-binding MarR family transcriptional regulator